MHLTLLPRLPTSVVGAARVMAGGAAAFSLQPAAFADEVIAPSGAALPDDSIAVGIALTLFVLTLLLNASLGDVVGDEAQLPSSVNLINKNRQRRSTFIKGRKGFE